MILLQNKALGTWNSLVQKLDFQNASLCRVFANPVTIFLIYSLFIPNLKYWITSKGDIINDVQYTLSAA